MSEWIEHNGGKPDLNGDEFVETRHRDGSTIAGTAVYIAAQCWLHTFNDHGRDIVAYRVVEDEA